ncbi:MAG: MmcQ/YjbR family DNA-binding protein [Nostocoides sp.]
MTTADAVLALGSALPRTHEQVVRGRLKLKIGAIVYAAFSADEREVGFGFPKVERDDLVASRPDTFFLPPTGDLRYAWVCAHLDRLDEEEMRELVTDAWRMCVPRMLHELPDLPAPTAVAWSAIDAGDWATARPLLHPRLHFVDGPTSITGRTNLARHIAEHPRPRPPREVEVRGGQIHRWVR